MEKLRVLKVHGYFNYEDSFDFKEENSWTGHVILREDLTFEGIVNDKSSEDKDRLISGTLVEYNGASLMKFTNGGFCPCSFYGMSTGKAILGTWTAHDYIFTSVQGRCKIIFTEIPLEEKLISDLESKMNSFKSEMDDYSKELYNSLIENMSLTVNNFIINMDTNRDMLEIEIGSPLQKLEL